MTFDYCSPAELFTAKRKGGPRQRLGQFSVSGAICRRIQRHDAIAGHELLNGRGTCGHSWTISTSDQAIATLRGLVSFRRVRLKRARDVLAQIALPKNLRY